MVDAVCSSSVPDGTDAAGVDPLMRLGVEPDQQGWVGLSGGGGGGQNQMHQQEPPIVQLRSVAKHGTVTPQVRAVARCTTDAQPIANEQCCLVV